MLLLIVLEVDLHAPVSIAFADVNGDGKVLADDFSAVKSKFFSSAAVPSFVTSRVREIEAACEHAFWELAEVVTDRESGRSRGSTSTSTGGTGSSCVA